MRELRVPVLKKDFHVDPIQLVEAKALGASAALLIVRALSPASLRRMTDAGRSLGLELLVEVRDDEELRARWMWAQTMIGINNRNLETLVIEPGDRRAHAGAHSVVRRRGCRERRDLALGRRATRASGADAVLVGSVVSAADDPAGAVRALAGVATGGREH